MKHIHILGACGTFMGGIAAIAREAGYRVTGSDRGIYPPMSDQLARLGIELVEGFDAGQLDPAPDVVVVGNVMTRGMPVIEAMLERGLPWTSGPEWLATHVLRDRHVIAVSGTHGKTTTTSLLAWIFESAGRNVGFLIGGAPADFEFSARLGTDPVFVIEADEYDIAFFDKRAKFLHYRPRTLVINNIEYDHADIYPDLDAILNQFHQLVRTVPGNGRIVVPAADPVVDRLLARGCWTPLDRFGGPEAAGAEWQGIEEPAGTFRLRAGGRELGACRWRMAGAYNAENAVAALLAARHAGVDPPSALQAIGRFGGVRRRLQRLGDFGGVQLFDDFAHHPTAIRRTLAGLRGRPGIRRLVAVFEPRSNTMKLGVHRETLVDALSGADLAWVHRPGELGWDVGGLFADAAGVRVQDDIDRIVAEVAAESRPGDAIVVMSNGAFFGLHGRLAAALAARHGGKAEQ